MLLSQDITTLSPALALEDCEFPAIFNFGDSNSDTGGLSSSLYQAPPPYGETYFHKPAGRFSDGRLIIDFLAKSLGHPYLSAYLDSLGTNFSCGANFATAASTIRLPDPIIPAGGFSPFYLNIQYMQFMQLKSRSQHIRHRGGLFASLMPKEEYFSKALYTFDIGQNDLGEGFFDNQTIQEVNASVPDIMTQKDEVGCAKSYNEVAQHFNHKLREAIVQLRKDLPLATFTYVDIYSVKYSLYKEPKRYGFELPLVACCGYGGKYNFNSSAECGGTVGVNGSQNICGFMRTAIG
ncbi:esterase-like [Prunus yedoensis var. nudiflora]|uniref:Esterase-like n=1 Tax=Prunus yedoensis var. nudiflora TaxID=2094558 RepID=A0A314Y096_PRUYE|nr:esterase-like [Prunus yedoensis var. nudiflora]